MASTLDRIHVDPPQKELTFDPDTPEGKASIKRRRQNIEDGRKLYGESAKVAAMVETDDVNPVDFRDYR